MQNPLRHPHEGTICPLPINGCDEAEHHRPKHARNVSAQTGPAPRHLARRRRAIEQEWHLFGYLSTAARPVTR